MSVFEVVQGYVLVAMLFALPTTLLIAWGLLALYRRAVIRQMKFQTTAVAEVLQSDQAANDGLQPRATDFSVNYVDSAVISDASSEVGKLFKGLQRGPWRTALVYGLAGFCYAFLIAIVKLKADGIELFPSRLTIHTLIFFWPTILVYWIVLGRTLRFRALLVGIYFFIGIVLSTIIASSSPAYDWFMFIMIWYWINGWPTGALLFVLNRKIHTIGPLVLTILFFGIIGSISLFQYIVNQEIGLMYINSLRNVLGLTINQMVVVIFGIGFLVVGLVGWFVVKVIQAAYEARKISDQSMLTETIWFLFSIFYWLMIGISRVDLIPLGILAYLVFRLLIWGGMRILRRKSPWIKSPVSMLLLRVFSLGRRSEQLYDALSIHWRYVGNLRLISGPDLAATTIDPHEFLCFLSGKTKKLFTYTIDSLENGINELRDESDPDGRFRAVEFFCHADVWKDALARLVKLSGVIVMDLRSFGPQHKGCIFEINALMDLIPLERVLLLVDDTTDTTFLHQTLQSAWAYLDQDSPNREGEKVVQLYRFEGPKDLTGLLQTLSVSAVS